MAGQDRRYARAHRRVLDTSDLLRTCVTGGGTFKRRLMPVEATCPKCLTRLRGPENAPGRMVECPRCRQVFRFPRSTSVTASAVEAAPVQNLNVRACPVCNAQVRTTARACGACGATLSPLDGEPSPTASAHTIPAPPQSPYPSDAYPATVVHQARNSGLAIASLVLGLLGLCGIGSILAIIFGAVAIRQIDESNGALTGKGMAKAGLILGIIWLAISAVWWATVLGQGPYY